MPMPSIPVAKESKELGELLSVVASCCEKKDEPEEITGMDQGKLK